MKTRKNIITVPFCAALSLTACTGKETKEHTTDTQTTDAASTPESSSEINDLFQQETSCLQIIRMNGTKHLLWQTKLCRPKRKLWGLPC